MQAFFSWRGVDYRVSGWLWSADGAHNGLIVTRRDGHRIRGATMHPGMVQLGISDGLERAAKRALEAERERTAKEAR